MGMTTPERRPKAYERTIAVDSDYLGDNEITFDMPVYCITITNLSEDVVGFKANRDDNSEYQMPGYSSINYSAVDGIRFDSIDFKDVSGNEVNVLVNTGEDEPTGVDA